MKSNAARKGPGRLITSAGTAIAVAAFGMAGTESASAYVGPSFIQIPGIDGGWQGARYKAWFRAEGNYWASGPMGNVLAGFGKSPLFFSGPSGPRTGAGKLVVAIDKANPFLPQLMEKCVQKTPIAELTYAEESMLARSPREMGPRPASVPEFFEYKIKDAQIVECPVVADAPQQAFVIAFNNIERLNFQEDSVPITLTPASYVPAPNSGKSKTFVLTWLGTANLVSDDQCPVMNAKPTEADYYALMSKEDADKERVENVKRGGVSFQNGQMGLRRPNKLNVTLLPGVVRDPGNAVPQTKVAHGLNLDGDDGTGAPPAGIRKHPNYVSEDGKVTGIDNQLYRVEGCIASWQGHKGFQLQFANNQMRDGMMSMLIQITGIDNERNDDNVEVSLFYSLDPMAKNASGTQILPDYTFRVTDNPQYAHYAKRMRARIVDSVVLTETVKTFPINLERYNNPNELQLEDARMRLVLTPDGNLKGVLGGYRDWRPIVSRYISSTVEQYHGFQVPGLYNALRREADGLQDPVTGEYNGISAAYDIEGIPVFIALPAPQPKIAQAKPAQTASAAPMAAPAQTAP